MKKLITMAVIVSAFFAITITPINAASYYYTEITNVRANTYIPWLSNAEYNTFKNNGTIERLLNEIKALNLDFTNTQIMLIYNANPTVANKNFRLYVLPYNISDKSMNHIASYSDNVTSPISMGNYTFDKTGKFFAYGYESSANALDSTTNRLLFFDGMIDLGYKVETKSDSYTVNDKYCSSWNISNNVVSCRNFQSYTGSMTSSDSIYTHNYGYSQQTWEAELMSAFNTKAIDREIQQDLNKGIEDINNTLNDNSVDTSQAGDFFEGFESDSYGLTSIITAPLELIKKVNNQSCSPIGVPLPYVDTTMELPCMETVYREMFGGFLDLYQAITTGFISYYVLVKIFAVVKGMKDPTNDDIEVMDL